MFTPELAPPELSIIIPMFNESPVLDALFARLEPVLDGLNLSYEILCVDDGSRDDTVLRLRTHHERNPRIKLLCLSRNFGKEAALSAGLDAARGQAIIPIDADLQDPPELIGQFVAQWREGYEMVYGIRSSRTTDTAAKRLTAGCFYRIFNRLSPVSIPENAGDFRLIDRKVVDILKTLPEHNRFMKGLFAWVGFRQIGIPYARESRVAGHSSWNYWRLWNFALDGITAFSTIPLRVWTYLGFLIAASSIGYGLYLILRTWIYGPDVPGYPSLMVVILVLGGLQMMTLGIIGEYLARMFYEVKGRPLYIVAARYGINSGE